MPLSLCTINHLIKKKTIRLIWLGYYWSKEGIIPLKSVELHRATGTWGKTCQLLLPEGTDSVWYIDLLRLQVLGGKGFPFAITTRMEHQGKESWQTRSLGPWSHGVGLPRRKETATVSPSPTWWCLGPHHLMLQPCQGPQVWEVLQQP